MNWTSYALDKLPIRNGFRMRGESMTRLEVFSDAAFAFAVTTLVVSVGSIPGNFDELILALKKVPSFGLSFAQIAVFWIAHRSWSRRYGLEDKWTTGLTLSMVFTILVYVFPLRLIFSSFLAWATQGWIPGEFETKTVAEIQGLFVVYGIGFFVLTGILSGLFYRALKSAEELGLNSFERIRTEEGVAMWLIQSGVGLVSALWALLLPASWGVMAGFLYFVIPIAMPIVGVRYGRKAKRILAALENPETREKDETDELASS
ncbi:hypothetical protein VDG1235_1658 [Verrucomicrobiia bacterium DG1235]|nr:hypothetical protein VDG1235_1658 [Verrucomicrobiae bacterium DG1235]